MVGVVAEPLAAVEHREARGDRNLPRVVLIGGERDILGSHHCHGIVNGGEALRERSEGRGSFQ